MQIHTKSDPALTFTAAAELVSVGEAAAILGLSLSRSDSCSARRLQEVLP